MSAPKHIKRVALPGAIVLALLCALVNVNTKVEPSGKALPSGHMMGVRIPEKSPLENNHALMLALESAAGNSTSMRILLNNLIAGKPSFIDDDEDIIVEREAQRCKRFNLKYNNRTSRRRIFVGGMIADDSFHTLGIHAMEAWGVYTNYAFVESNRTHIYVPRTMRFLPSSQSKLLLEHIFGPSTRVTVDYYMVDQAGNLTEEKLAKDGIFGQQLHRDVAVSRWKKEGMRPDDIGIILDVDEMFTRDFLRALQICETPEFQLENTCRAPKIHVKGLFFDASPHCARDPVRSTTYQPTAIIGECIEGIGDEQKHGLAKRVYKERFGYRQPGYGGGEDNWTLIAGPNFPLYNGVDFRRTGGGRQIGRTNIKHDVTGFHINNFFLTGDDIRFKFSTYGEPQEASYWKHGLYQKPMNKLSHEAVKRLLQCAASDVSRGATGRTSILNLKNLIERNLPVPQAFKLSQYVKARHQELIQLVKEDKAKYG